MSKKLFKNLSFLLALVLVMISLQLPVMADDTFKGAGDIEYKVTGENEASVTGPSDLDLNNPVIPRRVYNGDSSYTVTSVGYEAFKGDAKLTGTLKIEGGDADNDFNVNENAFADCTGLTAVIIGPYTYNPDGEPFTGCTGLQKITNNSERWTATSNPALGTMDIPQIEKEPGIPYEWFDIKDADKKNVITQVANGQTAVREDYVAKSATVRFQKDWTDDDEPVWADAKDGADFVQTVKEDEKVKNPGKLPNDGNWENVGWCSDEDAEIDWDFDKPVDESKFVEEDGKLYFNLYSKWEEKTFDISTDKLELEVGKSEEIYVKNEDDEAVVIDGEVKTDKEGIVEAKTDEDKKIVTITALAEGTVVVSLPYNGTEYKCEVTVKKGSGEGGEGGEGGKGGEGGEGGEGQKVVGEVKLSDLEIEVGLDRYKCIYLYDENNNKVELKEDVAQETGDIIELDDAAMSPQVMVIGRAEGEDWAHLEYDGKDYICHVTVKNDSKEGELYAPSDWHSNWTFDLYDLDGNMIQDWKNGVYIPDFPTRYGVRQGTVYIQKYRGKEKHVVVPAYLSYGGATFKTAVRDATMLGHSDDKNSIESINLSEVDFSQATGFNGAFEFMKKLQRVTLGTGDNTITSDAYSMFEGCESLTYVDFNELKFSNAKNVDKMFKDCSSMETLDLSKLDFSKVERAFYFMDNCNSLQVFISPELSPNSCEIPFPFTLYNNMTGYDALPTGLVQATKFTRDSADSMENINDDSVSGNVIKEVKEETRGSYVFSYAHTVPFFGKAKLKPEDLKLTVSFNGAPHNVTKATIKVKKGAKTGTIKIKKVDGVTGKDLKELKKALKGNDLTFDIVPYVVTNISEVVPKINKKGVLKKVTITIFQKKYKAKKGEYKYDEPTKSIVFDSDNLKGSWRLQ